MVQIAFDPLSLRGGGAGGQLFYLSLNLIQNLTQPEDFESKFW